MINVAIISLAITVAGENRKMVACSAELVLVARALLYVASWLAREGGVDFAKQQEVEGLPYLSQLSVLSPSDVLFNITPPTPPPTLLCLSHTISLAPVSSNSPHYSLSVGVVGERAKKKKKEGHAALTCDLADPFSLQTKRPILQER